MSLTITEIDSMKIRISLLATACVMAGSAWSKDHYVAPHTTKNGTYVQGHYQTNPNGTRNDNYSTKGNINPYTGKSGTKAPDGTYKPKN